MTNDQIIHEARGLCWHEQQEIDVYECSCGNSYTYPSELLGHLRKVNPSYASSWSDYGPMLEWAMRQEWWYGFCSQEIVQDFETADLITIFKVFLNPLAGSTAIAEFLKERKND